jgi:hypothetical protein
MFVYLNGNLLTLIRYCVVRRVGESIHPIQHELEGLDKDGFPSTFASGFACGAGTPLQDKVDCIILQGATTNRSQGTSKIASSKSLISG